MSSMILPQKFCSTCVKSMGSKKGRVVFKRIQNSYSLKKMISFSFNLSGNAYNRLDISTKDVKSVDKRWVNKGSMSSMILPQKFCSTLVHT